ncbi:asparagine synthase-related protein [Lysobacter sp. KIS68-7]|uniref:asparagine synthase-related protein n=1 Tax=Lysobacter sp. KIS68-7 TaxID=2904252 RepID=UPI001E4E41A8|nr:asparagine synthase-related protein [Lysobacter sp. KIS68-7]UHQ18585.1 asparagine synthase-related protein [Lysobacter sp. KIS68-7]
MNVSTLDTRSYAPPASASAAPKQITMSPYYGTPDFSGLSGNTAPARTIDLVSVADILRNAFVYPPHSIFEDVKLVTFGFSPSQDMLVAPEFHFKFRDSGKRGETEESQDWVGTYHRLLVEAVAESTRQSKHPWLLQSGGKDSTTLAIAVADARPDATCITYLGGREEDEVDSATFVAKTLGLRHETLTCDPGRAYDRYLAVADRMPLLTADFALLSYVDLATEIIGRGGDGVIDGLGADSYFGTPMSRQQRMLARLARRMRLPINLAEMPFVERNFELCFLLGTLQMESIERVFPGSRFTDAEVDELFGRPMSQESYKRLDVFREEIATAASQDEWRDISTSIAGSAGAFAKGLYTCSALGMHAAYPFCDVRFREWVYREVPPHQMIDPESRVNKVLVRSHIATRFPELPYVRKKGSFRFDLRGLASSRFDTVHDFAVQARDVLPGAVTWLERNRHRLGNKYHASKFYLLAVVLPWIQLHRSDATPP